MSREDRFLRACRREPVDTTPIWIMRQAGRYLPAYRRIRERYDFMTLCKTPDAATEVTLQPVDTLGVDAAILFSDILIPVEAMGVEVAFGDAGPCLTPVTDDAGIARLAVPDPDERVPFVMEAVRQIRKTLDGAVPLIGFAGAPFTLLTYVVEGKTSRDLTATKRLLYEAPATARRLLQKLADMVALYLNAQIRAGVQVVQLFDTWAGQLAPADYAAFALPFVKSVIDRIEPRGQVPVILYVNSSATLLSAMASAGADVLSIDWRQRLDDVRRTVGDNVALQGNLDPAALFLPPDAIEARAAEILAQANGAAGHIFNLGHGILPETPVEHAQALVEAVHHLGQRPQAPSQR